MLVEIARFICKNETSITFHVVGKKFNDPYQASILQLIEDYQLQNHVFLYDSKNDIPNILSQSTIGILTSKSEGLPVSILEYGLCKLPVIATNVGQIKEVIINNETGFLIENNDKKTFENKLLYLINNPQICSNFANTLNQHIQKNYSKEAVINHYLNLIT